MYKRPWRKRKNKNINGITSEYKSIPFIQLHGNEKLLFFIDDDNDNWRFYDIYKWMNKFSETFPDIKFAVFPVSIFKDLQKITGKEYSMLNNILKRCVDKNKVNNNENS